MAISLHCSQIQDKHCFSHWFWYGNPFWFHRGNRSHALVLMTKTKLFISAISHREPQQEFTLFLNYPDSSVKKLPVSTTFSPFTLQARWEQWKAWHVSCLLSHRSAVNNSTWELSSGTSKLPHSWSKMKWQDRQGAQASVLMFMKGWLMADTHRCCQPKAVSHEAAEDQTRSLLPALGQHCLPPREERHGQPCFQLPAPLLGRISVW